MSDPKFIDLSSNAFKAVQAWRFAALALAATAGLLAIALVYQARNLPVVLIPHDLASSSARMTVPLNGELRGTSFEYMANAGLSDLTLILNFTPENVITQHQRFMNRLTESLYGQQREELLAQAQVFKSRAVTQSFYPTDIKVSADYQKVEVTGTQLRWVGGKESVRSTVTYFVTYSMFKGYLHVADLRQKSDVNETK
jgi:type IV conjugative transfer system protein TraE